MAEIKSLKLQRSESFYIRDGWIEKLFMAIQENKKGIFSQSKGTRILGVGSNMVKSLRYWGEACRLVSQITKDAFDLSENGKLIYDNDPYLETNFSWGLIHYWLVTNFEYAPVFYKLFNDYSLRIISRKETPEYLQEIFNSEGYELLNIKALQKDVATFISSYLSENSFLTNPEENLNCPLSNLGLLKKNGKEGFEKQSISYNIVDYRLLYICLREHYKEMYFNIDDAIYEECSPAVCFNMERPTFLSLLGDMKRADLIDLNVTAGLNTVYLKSQKTDDELFKDYINDIRGGIKK